MKLRKFLTLFLLSTGAFFVLSNQNVKADGEMCNSIANWCYDDCVAAFNTQGTAKYLDMVELQRCGESCNSNELSCLSAFAWQNYWLQTFDFTITDDFFLIDDGPNPICATYPDALVGCGSLPTAEEIEVCTLMVQQEQAHNNCPQ